MPQNEIANSPSTPVVVEGGPYAGQMFIGDVTYGGLQRADLEKVDGRYQGALFRMTQGLEAGVSRVLKGPDGSLIIGGLGAGGNWGQTGKLRYGLQKLDLSGDVPFDMESMDVIEGGFEITYTQPLSAATLEDLASQVPARAVALPRHGPVRRSQARRGVARRHQRDRQRGRPYGHPPGRRHEARPRRAPALPAPVRVRVGRDAVEHRGLVHPQQLPRLRRDRPGARSGRHLRARGRRAVRHRRHRRPSTPATPGRASSTASRPSARAPRSRWWRRRRAPTTCRSATPTARTRSPTRPRR